MCRKVSKKQKQLIYGVFALHIAIFTAKCDFHLDFLFHMFLIFQTDRKSPSLQKDPGNVIVLIKGNVFVFCNMFTDKYCIR